MKPEYTANVDGSVVSNNIDTEAGSSSKDSNIKNEEMDGFSSEILRKTQSVFEIYNSFLYEDVHENASSLEKYLSANSTCAEKINGTSYNENEIIDEKYSDASQKLYSSLKKYSLRNINEAPELSEDKSILSAKKTYKNNSFEYKVIIPDTFQLPLSNETCTSITYDVSMFENNIDIKFPTYNSSGISKDLTEAQRSVRLNKRPTLKKNIKKSSNKKLVVPYKAVESSCPKDILSRDLTKKIDLKNAKSSSSDSEIDSHCAYFNIIINEIKAKEVHVEMIDFLKYSQVFKTQLKNKNDALCFEKALSKFDELKKIIKSKVKPVTEKNNEKTLKKQLNKRKSGKYLKKNESSSEVNVNKTNDVINESFIPIVQNANVYQPKSSKNVHNLIQEGSPEKFKLNINDNLTMNNSKETPPKKRGRKKLILQNEAKPAIKFQKKYESLKNAELEIEYSLNESDVEDEGLSVNVEKDLAEKEMVVDKNLKWNQKSKSIQLFNTTNTPASKKRNTPKRKIAKDVSNNKDLHTDDADLSSEVGKDLTKEDIAVINKSLNKNTKTAKFYKTNKLVSENSPAQKILKKQTTSKKKAATENADILNINNIVQNTLSVNEVKKDFAKDKITSGKNIKQKQKSHSPAKKTPCKKNISNNKVRMEKEYILNENDVENASLSVSEVRNDLVKSKKVTVDTNVKQNQKLKSAQLFKTSMSVSQNSSVKSIFQCLNESKISKDNPSNFLQLFNKVVESSASESFLKSGNSIDSSIAKLFKRDNSKSRSPSKISIGLDQNHDEKQLCKSNSSEGNSTDLKPLKSVGGTSAKRTPRKKRSVEGNVGASSQRMKKCNQDSVKRNKNMKVEISSRENDDKNYKVKIKNANKLTVPRSGQQTKVNTSLHKGRKFTQELEKEDDAIFPELGNSCSDENFDACSLIKVTDVKSLANCNEKKRKNMKKEKIETLIPASFSKDTQVVLNKELSVPVSRKRNKRNEKSDSLNASECAVQPGKNISSNISEFNFDDKRITKRKRRSTSVDPNFYYEVMSPQTKKKKSVPIHETSTELDLVKKSPRRSRRLMKESHFINGMADVKTCESKAQYPNSSLNPMSVNHNQVKEAVSFTLQPVQKECKIVVNEEQNFCFLTTPVQFSSVVVPSITGNDNMSQICIPFQTQNYSQQNVPTSQFAYSLPYVTPMASSSNLSASLVQQQHNLQPSVSSRNVTSVIPGQSNQPLHVSKNASAAINPYCVSSAVSSQNTSSGFAASNPPYLSSSVPSTITSSTVSPTVNPGTICSQSSGELSTEQYSKPVSTKLISSVRERRQIMQNSTVKCKTYMNYINILESELKKYKLQEKFKSDLDINWKMSSFESNAGIDLDVVDETAQKYYGKFWSKYTIREFCTNPDVIDLFLERALATPTGYLKSRIDYKFDDSLLDEPFVDVLKDYVDFYMQKIFENMQNKSEEDLRLFFVSEVYAKLSVGICFLFPQMVPPPDIDVNINTLITALTLASAFYIFSIYYRKLKIV